MSFLCSGQSPFPVCVGYETVGKVPMCRRRKIGISPKMVIRVYYRSGRAPTGCAVAFSHMGRAHIGNMRSTTHQVSMEEKRNFETTCIKAFEKQLITQSELTNLLAKHEDHLTKRHTFGLNQIGPDEWMLTITVLPCRFGISEADAHLRVFVTDEDTMQNPFSVRSEKNGPTIVTSLPRKTTCCVPWST
jgi:hypothetical protein